MHDTSDNVRRLQRVLLNVAMVGWFAAVAFWFGPHVILFHKLTRMTPLDFVPVVDTYCVPAVRAIKIYQRTHGRMPASMDDLGPGFSSHQTSGTGMHEIDTVGTYTYWAFGMYNHYITYDFTPGHEGWTVHGAFANGPVPVPPVTLGAIPTTRP
jgi:hypothetical protein